ncbi:reverse transcriptase [Gossypium australe]|uniref:Reverse transcriptase n=1 Tax=Gossypium australe TaxID=47621 RepID=A0A5B6VTS7_9ROSI|nr:reverse transcriptase [Gossypium australe]
MLQMGFAKKWVSLIMKCVSTVSYAVDVNGNRGRMFHPTRGLRQGDPFSPYLFLICSEGLSALIRQSIGEGFLKGVKASRMGPAISHLLFADDCLLFGEATKERALFLKNILKQYERCSGQCVNFNKSTIFFSSNIAEGARKEISDVLRVRCSTNIEKYLGLPNIVGRKKKESFQKCLSQGGKEVFIKSVLQAIPTYAMTCFLLPKTLCGDIESIFAKYWWQHGKKKRGIHWCQWKLMCRPKEDGGMGFRNMSQFNISLLAKQGWRIMNNADSLVTKVLKEKYFPNDQFLNSRLGNSCSYTWKSTWAAKDVLRKGENISINNDAWILEALNFRLSSEIDSLRDCYVHSLIDNNTRKWKEEMIKFTFAEEDAARILHIPLADDPHDDFLAWEGEASGEFSVRSAYKLLQNTEEYLRAYALQTSYRKFYKKLWLLDLPTKIKITIWRVTWNFLPTKVNLQHKKLVTDASCPRCGDRAKTLDHLFRECPVTVDMWSALQLQNVLLAENRGFEQWLIWVCEHFNLQICRLFCCALWATWGDRNSKIHDNKVSTGNEIGNFINSYIAELDGLEKMKTSKVEEMKCWSYPPRNFVKVNFDGAFDGKNNVSASGVVIRDNLGITLLSRSKVHKGVLSAFAAEALACRIAVKTAMETTWSDIIIEGDSLTTIRKCNSRHQDKSMIGAYIRDIQRMATRSKHFVFKHTPRTANILAHRIVTETLRSKEEIYLEGGVPSYAEIQRWRESVREPD